MGTPAIVMAREDSVPVGIIEHRLWKPFGDLAIALTPGRTDPRPSTKKDAWAFHDAVLEAARKFDHEGKMPGDRMGPLGPSGLKVLEALLEIADKMTGRLEPAIATICDKAKLARATVCRALVRLKNEGWLSYVRRKQLLDNDGAGPQIHQAPHAYWFKLKGRAEGLVRLALARIRRKVRPSPPAAAPTAAGPPQIPPELSSAEVARFVACDSALGDDLERLGRSLDQSVNSIARRNPDRQV
jgi:hypothetical protein